MGTLVNRAIEAATLLLLFGSALALGGVHPLATLLLGAVACGLAVTLVVRSHAPPAPAWVLFLLAGYTLLQATPLPVAWVSTLAPDNAQVWLDAYVPLGLESPTLIPISLAPEVSVLEAIRWGTYGVVLWGASHLRVSRGAAWCVKLVVLAGSVVALVVLAHGVVGAQRVYGLYTPSVDLPRWSTGPFINGNNLAGYLLFCAILGLGTSFQLRERSGLVMRIGAGLCGFVAILTGSRAGIVAFAVGLLVLFGLLRARGTALRLRSAAGAALPVVLGAGMAFVLMGRAMRADVFRADLDKLQLLGWTGQLTTRFWAFGTGRGAFGSVFPAFREASRDISYEHAENFVLQWGAEWGVVVTLCAAILFVTQCAWMFKHQRIVTPIVAIGAAAVLLQNLADLGLEVPGLCVLLAFAVGGVWSRRRLVAPTRWGWAPVMMLSGGLVAALVCTPRELVDERKAVQAAALVAERDGDWAALNHRLKDAVLRFPAEPYFYRVGARAALLQKRPNAIRWAELALLRDPVNGRGHLVVADVLHGLGANQQAMLELRLAVESHDDLAVAAVERARRWTRDPSVQLRMVPDGEAGAPILNGLGASGATDNERSFLLAAIHRNPDYLPPRKTLAHATLRSLKNSRPPCDDARVDCVLTIEAQGSALVARDDADGYALLAELKLLEGDAPQALRLSESCESLANAGTCQLLGVSAALAAQDLPRAKEFAKAVLNGCKTPQICGARANEIAGRFAGAGQHAIASKYYLQAAEYDDTADSWLRAVDATQKAGQRAETFKILRRVSRRYPDDPRVSSAMERARAAAVSN
ncbi:MAG: O-antigen ligase family protein [Polyangiaceae bacterium]